MARILIFSTNKEAFHCYTEGSVFSAFLSEWKPTLNACKDTRIWHGSYPQAKGKGWDLEAQHGSHTKRGEFFGSFIQWYVLCGLWTPLTSSKVPNRGTHTAQHSETSSQLSDYRSTLLASAPPVQTHVKVVKQPCEYKYCIISFIHIPYISLAAGTNTSKLVPSRFLILWSA